jgi:predicted oxidoreductase
MTPGEVLGLVDCALAEGIDLFDHADIYGGGEAETLFGEAMALRPGLRDGLFLQSKCGIRKGQYDLSGEHILRSTEQILSRLKTDRLDMLLLHRPDALMEPEEIAGAFDRLRREGKVRFFGVSNMNAAQIELIQRHCAVRLIANQLQFSAAHTAIIDSGINVNVPGVECFDPVLEYCRMKKVTIQSWSPLQYGFFEGVFLGSSKCPELNRALSAVADREGVTPAAVAVAWILRHPADMQVILGSTNANRIHEMAAAAKANLTRQDWYEIYRAAGNRLP